MFERLDDDAGAFVADERFRTRVDVRVAQLRRRRRTGRAGLGAATFVVGAAVGAGLYVDRRDAAIDRVEVSAHPSTDGAVNVLLVGSDARSGGDGAPVLGTRADTIAILRLDDAGSRLLSIPRDLFDPRGPGEADDGRINGALDDGPQAMIDAVSRTTGIPVDHYVELGFDGFVDLVDAAGGIDAAVTDAVRDEQAGLALGVAPCTTLDGETALALARSRRLERFDPATGTWEADPTGDIGRISRQHAVLGLALDQLGTDPASLDRYSRLLADHAVVDDGLTLGRLIELGRRLADGPALVTDVVPVTGFRTDTGASVLVLGIGASALLAEYGATGLPWTDVPHDPGVLPTGLVPVTAC